MLALIPTAFNHSSHGTWQYSTPKENTMPPTAFLHALENLLLCRQKTPRALQLLLLLLLLVLMIMMMTTKLLGGEDVQQACRLRPAEAHVCWMWVPEQ